MMKPKTQAYIQLSLLALGLGLFLWLIYPKDNSASKEVVLTDTVEATTTLPIFNDVSIEAKSAYVYDTLTKKVLFEKNPDLQLPLASLTKIMTALTASNILPDKNIVQITNSDLREEGDSGLILNEKWNVKNLIDFSLIVSSNDGAHALASVAGAFINLSASSSPTEKSSPTETFVKEMNKTANKLGLTETYFLNQSGLDISKTLAGAYGSAKDMSLLVDYILRTKPHLLEATSFNSLNIPSNTTTHMAINTDKVIDLIPNVIASKTGFTDLAGGNLVVAFDVGIAHPVIVAILGSSFDGRFKDMAKLVSSTVEYLSH